MPEMLPMRPDRPSHGLVMTLALFMTTGTLAQLPADNPDWKETEVPAPPAFDAKRVIVLEGSRASALTMGIDPATVAITPDGIVRYVMVASNTSGAMNVMYEGIRCTTAQYRVYARYREGSGWVPVRNSEWVSLYAPMPSKHPLSLARSGVCTGRAPNSSVAEIVRALKSPSSPGF
jgi:hypothetical protein